MDCQKTCFGFIQCCDTKLFLKSFTYNRKKVWIVFFYSVYERVDSNDACFLAMEGRFNVKDQAILKLRIGIEWVAHPGTDTLDECSCQRFNGVGDERLLEFPPAAAKMHGDKINFFLRQGSC